MKKVDKWFTSLAEIESEFFPRQAASEEYERVKRDPAALGAYLVKTKIIAKDGDDGLNGASPS
jgi:hypothetical protein